MSELTTRLEKQISERNTDARIVNISILSMPLFGIGGARIAWDAIDFINSGNVHHPTWAVWAVGSVILGGLLEQDSSRWNARTRELEDQLYLHQSNLEVAAIQAGTTEYRPYDWTQDEEVAVQHDAPQPTPEPVHQS